MRPGGESDPVYIRHMLECIERVESYTAEGSNAFRNSTLIQDAVVRNLQIMAESSQRLSDTTKSQVNDIPWRAIAGFRNMVVHGYMGLDLELIWTVVDQDLPPLKAALQRLAV